MLPPLQRVSDLMFADQCTYVPPRLQGTGVSLLDVKNGRIEVTTELLSLGRADATVNVVGDILVVNDEERQKEAGGTRTVTERVYGGVARALDLRSGMRPEELEASMNERVMPVRLSQLAMKQSEPTRVAVKKNCLTSIQLHDRDNLTCLVQRLEGFGLLCEAERQALLVAHMHGRHVSAKNSILVAHC
jgi:HSP20 family molecular chaperone IbpA